MPTVGPEVVADGPHVDTGTAAATAFPFPFEPYAMQREVMAAIRDTIHQARICVIESPTGTGKSQMLLNGVLSTVYPPCPTDGATAAPTHVDNNKRPRLPNRQSGRRRGRRKPRSGLKEANGDEDLLHQSEGSDDATARCHSTSSSSSDASLSDDDDDDPLLRPLATPKVYFSSRTHSQLTQLAQELRRTVFSDAPTRANVNGSPMWPSLRFVHVASRAQLCINPCVQRNAGSNHQRLNDLCRSALRVGGTKDGRAAVKAFWKLRGVNRSASTGTIDVEDLRAGMGSCEACPFAHAERLKVLKDYARGSSRTLEELKDLGKSVGACPFLATKALIREAHVVLLPYSYLIDNVARSQLLPDELFEQGAVGEGQQDDGDARRPRNAFRGNVVVFDEAHHVADVARRSSSAAVTTAQLDIVASLLRAYAQRYEQRLLAKNKAKIRELIGFSERLSAYATSSWAGACDRSAAPGDGNRDNVCSTLSDVLFGAQVDYVNTCALVHFLEESMLVHKLPSQAHAAAMADRMANAAVAASHQGQQEVRRCGSDVWGQVGKELTPFLSMAIGHRGAHHDDAPNAPVQCRQLLERLQQAAQVACLGFLAFLRCVSQASWTETVAILRPWDGGEAVVSAPTAAAAAISGGALSPVAPCAATLPPTELRILSLTGAASMAAIVGNARSLIFAGGTMQPLSMLVDPLLLGQDVVAANQRVAPGLLLSSPTGTCRQNNEEVPLPLYDHRSFPHVIPASSLRVLTLGCGPSGRPVELTYSNRAHLTTQWEDVGRTLVNLCRIIPHGVIVCFTSYAMESSFFEAAARNGILDQLEGIKRVFRETRTNNATAAKADASTDLLTLYSKWIENNDLGGRGHHVGDATCGGTRAQTVPQKRGALLSCVMGGKLAEGINFNDHLGRGVVVVGLPYPNPADVELNLQMAMCAQQMQLRQGSDNGCSNAHTNREDIASVSTILNDTTKSTGSTRRKTNAEMELYHAVCMRSVNQCMGRCIRHSNDFAVVVLLDARFRRPEVSRHISAWMQPSIMHCAAFGDCFRSVRDFFEIHPSA